MNILLFGKDGQLGKAFQEQLQHSFFQKGNNIYSVGRNECDLSDASQITNLLNTLKPRLIINTAAYTDVDKAETESNLVFLINTVAPGLMAKYAAQNGATLLHFSSDYVFDGHKLDFYTESDMAKPLGVYGKSKVASEQVILSAFSSADHSIGQYAIFRTSWLYGDGDNFIRTILLLARDNQVLRVIDDQYGVPTSSVWLAQLTCYLALNDGKLRTFNSGIYHAVPLGVTNRYDLACLVLRVFLNSGKYLQTPFAKVFAVSSGEIFSQALRPKNCLLSRYKLQLELDRLGLMSKLPYWNTPWDEQVSDYVKHLSVN